MQMACEGHVAGPGQHECEGHWAHKAKDPLTGGPLCSLVPVRRVELPTDPPTFAVVGERDRIASPSTMERRIHALRRAGVVAEFRTYPALGHAFGTGTGTNAQGWIDEAVDFWQRAGRQTAPQSR